MADFVMKALHQDDIEHTICGAVPPCISLFASVARKKSTFQKKKFEPQRFQVAAGPPSSEDADRRYKGQDEDSIDATDFRLQSAEQQFRLKKILFSSTTIPMKTINNTAKSGVVTEEQ